MIRLASVKLFPLVIFVRIEEVNFLARPPTENFEKNLRRDILFRVTNSLSKRVKKISAQFVPASRFSAGRVSSA